LAAAIKGSFGVDSQLLEGSGGVFDVTVDSNLIFSKHQEGRFPDNKEILDLLQGG